MEYNRYQHLTVAVQDGIALVTLNRPEALNATNNRLHWELTQVWRTADRDPETRVVVVTGYEELIEWVDAEGTERQVRQLVVERLRLI